MWLFISIRNPYVSNDDRTESAIWCMLGLHIDMLLANPAKAISVQTTCVNSLTHFKHSFSL
jgi:hypothetical protein